MTHRKQKLELTWIGKENRPRLEPRIFDSSGLPLLPALRETPAVFKRVG